jgi:hypothetical protein
MKAVAEKKMKDTKKIESNKNPSSYGCEILLEKTTLEKANNPSFPNDACLIWYLVDDIEYVDLCRTSKRTSLFDMYYDKYGSGSIQRIDFGYGKTSPRLWNYKSPTPEKKKRK